MTNAHFNGLCEAAERAWPDLPVDRAELVRALSRLRDDDDPSPISEQIAVELALACMCARGVQSAVAAFDAQYLSALPAALAHMKLPGATVDEVRQIVGEKLLVGEDGAEPRVLRYAGRGSIRGLVKVMAVRTALSILRKQRRGDPEAVGALVSPEHDPELAFMKKHYRAAFKQAFEAAVGDLDSHDRNLLRLHLVGDMTLDQLAQMYGVHRSTVVRSLARARKTLFSGTRKDMRKQLRIDPDELDSVMNLIRSRLDVSVGRLLETTD